MWIACGKPLAHGFPPDSFRHNLWHEHSDIVPGFGGPQCLWTDGSGPSKRREVRRHKRALRWSETPPDIASDLNIRTVRSEPATDERRLIRGVGVIGPLRVRSWGSR